MGQSPTARHSYKPSSHSWQQLGRLELSPSFRAAVAKEEAVLGQAQRLGDPTRVLPEPANNLVTTWAIPTNVHRAAQRDSSQFKISNNDNNNNNKDNTTEQAQDLRLNTHTI